MRRPWEGTSPGHFSPHGALRARLLHIEPRYVLAILITGAGAGAGGILLTVFLHLVQHLSFGYTQHTFLRGVERASPVRRVLALTVGGAVAGTAWYIQRRHEGLQISVDHALHRGAKLPFIPTLFDASIQIVAVGAGASLGREGAPRQWGAATGAWISDHFGLTHVQRRTLVAAGAGGGLAAVYNVPFGGASYAAEILLASFAFADVVPAIVVSWIATVIAWPVLGRHPTYHLQHPSLNASILVAALLLGPACGAVAAAFRTLMKRMQRSVPNGWHEIPVLIFAFVTVGTLAIAYPEVLGNGKSASQVAFDGALGLAAAVALIAIKPIATAVCLRAGARGGLLTPAFATGAVLGVTAGHLWDGVWPGGAPAAFAVVGAAAVLATTQRAPLTAILLTEEFTHAGIALLGPITIAVALALITASALDRSLAAAQTKRSGACRPPRNVPGPVAKNGDKAGPTQTAGPPSR